MLKGNTQVKQQDSTKDSTTVLKGNTQVKQQDSTKDSTRNAVCAGCRRRHIKCTGDGVNACSSCESHGEQCAYPTRKRAGPRTGWLQQREEQYLEALREVEAHKTRIKELEDQLYKTQQRLITGEPLAMAEREVMILQSDEFAEQRLLTGPLAMAEREGMILQRDKFADKQGSMDTSNNWSSASNAHSQQDCNYGAQQRLITGEPLTMAEKEAINLMEDKFAGQGSIGTSNWSSASQAQNRHNRKAGFKEVASLKRPKAKRLQADCIAPSPAEPQLRLGPWGIISKSSGHVSIDQLCAVAGSCT